MRTKIQLLEVDEVKKQYDIIDPDLKLSQEILRTYIRNNLGYRYRNPHLKYNNLGTIKDWRMRCVYLKRFLGSL